MSNETKKQSPQNLSIEQTMRVLGIAARKATESLAIADDSKRNNALRAAAGFVRERANGIIDANQEDMRGARSRALSAGMLDRLMLDPERIEVMASGLEAVAELPDPVGRVLAEWQRPNGLAIQRVSVPLGVVGIIYESRPNVTADAAALCIKSANVAILRGGSESYNSSYAIHACMRDGLQAAGLDPNAAQMVSVTDRSAVGYMLSSMAEFIDVVIPRGGKSLVKRVQDEARVPVIGHLDGICHVYIHAQADTAMACEIAVNAKMRRTGICGAAETILVDRNVAGGLLPDLLAALQAAGCEVRGDRSIVELGDDVVAASETDWSTEYLDAIVSVRVVDGLAAAIEHIRQYGSGHTESIVTDDPQAAESFLKDVDSAIVLHNASTQFADGGEFGMGAEIGIATGRIHARGPVGAEQLTTFKYILRGSGQVRP